MAHHDPHGWCTGCGHCLAVCHHDAILRGDAEEPPEPLGIEHPESHCGYEALLPFLQSKRSIRRYHARIPEREQITDHTIEDYRKFRTIIRLRLLLKTFLPRNLYKVLDSPGLLEGVNAMIRQREQGLDPILFEAPVVIVVYYQNMGALSLLDPTIAFTYGMLAAHSLGLGSCWIGFAIQSLYKDRRMRKLLGVPEDMIVAGVMTLGYPLPVYHRIPQRNPLQVHWLDGGSSGSDSNGKKGAAELVGSTRCTALAVGESGTVRKTLR
jgi:nitroreductase